MTPALKILLACARVNTTDADDAAIRQIVSNGIDWTLFAQMAVDHKLVGLAGRTLVRFAADMVPEDLVDAFDISIDQARQQNVASFDALVRVIETLATNKIEAIPLGGPVLGHLVYADLGLCTFPALEFLIRERDAFLTISALRSIGYERTAGLTEAQLDLIHRIQGFEILGSKVAGINVKPHTRLTPLNIAFDIDYEGIWLRAQKETINGRRLTTLAPEDNLLMLAIHGGKEMWRHLNEVCDFAAFIGKNPQLEWNVIVARARAQGCLRMVLLATSLVRIYLNMNIPDAVNAIALADPTIELMHRNILVSWLSNEPSGSPHNQMASADLIRLHDGLVRRMRHIARTVFLPGPHHIASVALPKPLSFAYTPIKFAHDISPFPASHDFRKVSAQKVDITQFEGEDILALAMLPSSNNLPPELNCYVEAHASASRAVAHNVTNAPAWRNLGDTLRSLKRYQEADACYGRAIAIAPDDLASWKQRSVTMEAIGQLDSALRYIDGALALDSHDANAWTVRARIFSKLRRFTEAIDACDHALAIDPENIEALREGIVSRLQSCDWSRRADDRRRISEGLQSGIRLISPFFHRNISSSEAESLVVARNAVKGFRPPVDPLWQGERYCHDKIRIAYISAEFHDHVVADTIIGCFEHHDRTRFDMTAISLGPDDGSKMRRRIETAFDRFIDVQAMSDDQVAAKLRELEIDIAIDLHGHAGAKRIGILARRSAPVQVTYLGYPGTLGATFVDYIIADHTVIPKESQIHYSEKVVYLPYTYMPTDKTRSISNHTPTRAEENLPEVGFVFACHNASYKIDPEIFAIWMRLLCAVEGSVLWLRSTNPSTMINLRREAKAKGVAPGRLVFARRMARTRDHLARLRLADLFLDTLPYNAHATATDALWAGLPLVTCRGKSFPGLVATSLLHAIGLPELVTESLVEYEKLTLSLATNAEQLAAIKAKLVRNRDLEPLFDTANFTFHLQSAYETMWKRAQCGEPHQSFSVEGQKAT